MDQFDLLDLNAAEELLRGKLQEQVAYCSYCQPYDGGDVVWIWGDRIELSELMDELKIAEKARDKITDHLICPSCGHSHFDISEVVGIKSDYDTTIELNYQKAEKIYGSKVQELEQILEDFPMLAAQNILSRKSGNRNPYESGLFEYKCAMLFYPFGSRTRSAEF